jgi:hypothetical protein
MGVYVDVDADADADGERCRDPDSAAVPTSIV